jgi:predicted aspartyl protease
MKSSWICLLLAGCLIGAGANALAAAKPAARPQARPAAAAKKPMRPAAKPLADPGGCYMIDASGRTVSLGKLCGDAGSSTSGGSSATPGSKAPGKSNVVIVPIKYRAGRTPVIEVTFNGSKRFDMIVDTGASSTLITKTMANSLNLKATGSRDATIADGSTITFPTGQMKSIEAGGISLSNAEVSIAVKMELGLLGHDFFGDYDIQIKEKTIEFSRRKA